MSDLFILRRRGTFLLIVLEMSGPVLLKRCRCVSSFFLQASGACEAAESTWEMVGASLSIRTCVQTARVCARDAWSECCWRWTRCSFSDMAYEHDSARVRAALWIPPRESILWIALLRLWHIYGGMQVRWWARALLARTIETPSDGCFVSLIPAVKEGLMSLQIPLWSYALYPAPKNEWSSCLTTSRRKAEVRWYISERFRHLSPKCNSHTMPSDYVIRHTEGCDASVASHWQQHQACPGDLVNRQWCWQSCLS